jgi:hypothetical protein
MREMFVDIGRQTVSAFLRLVAVSSLLPNIGYFGPRQVTRMLVETVLSITRLPGFSRCASGEPPRRDHE